MKPLPAEGSLVDRKLPGPAMPTALSQTGGSRSSANRKLSSGSGQRAYPLLLMASTAVAGFFCYLYLTKPVIVSAPVAGVTSGLGTSGSPQNKVPMIPSGTSSGNPLSDRLPGDPAEPIKAVVARPRPVAITRPGSDNPFEETNFQVQNVIMAETPDGIVNRISVKVPVVYRSRNLRWTKQEVATARELLTRLTEYQEKTRALRTEGVALANAWNRLVDHSIPTVGLQADSPTLPTNQQSAIAPSAGTPDAADAIHLQPNDK